MTTTPHADAIVEHLVTTSGEEVSGIADMVFLSDKVLDGPVAKAIAQRLSPFDVSAEGDALTKSAETVVLGLRALPADHVALVERWIAGGECAPGLRREGQSEIDHIRGNVSCSAIQFDLLAMSEENSHLPGIHAILLDPTLDDDGRVDAIAAIPDASTWIDWSINHGPHPEDGRFFARWDGDGHYDLTERGTWRVLGFSKWARWTDAMARLLSAHPGFVDEYAAAFEEGRSLAWGHPNPRMDAIVERIRLETVEWRSENLTFHDPFEPAKPLAELLATTAA